MPEVRVNGVTLHYERRGDGAPIVCIHGTGSSTAVWGEAVETLARIGRVIAYDRRGHGRSERPQPYERTSVCEHADDAAGLLAALAEEPAVVIGRSYGGAVATDLALRHPDRVRALVLLEPAELELVPAVAAWLRALGESLAAVAAESGVDAVGEAMITEALGEAAWEALPDEFRRLFTQNGAAILAEQRGEFLRADAAELATIGQPALLVAADDSVPLLREMAEALADTLPNARTASVAGGHLIDPADPAVIAFIEAVLRGR